MPSRRRVLLDTSFVIAVENFDDPLHDRACAVEAALMGEGVPLIVPWCVLIEIADGFCRLNRRHTGVGLLEKLWREDGVELYPLSEELLGRAVHLYQSRYDKEWSLTDCVSFVIMRDLDCQDALTADHHFVQAGFRALLLEGHA